MFLHLVQFSLREFSTVPHVLLFQKCSGSARLVEPVFQQTLNVQSVLKQLLHLTFVAKMARIALRSQHSWHSMAIFRLSTVCIYVYMLKSKSR